MLIPYASYVNSPGVEKSFDFKPEFTMVAGHPVKGIRLTRFTILSLKDRSVTVSFQGETTLEIPCDRCLTPVQVGLSFEAERKFDPDKKTDEDGYPVTCFREEGLDADRLIEEEIELNVPIQVLCSPTCKGICPKCFKNRNDGSCTCSDDGQKTRMAELLENAFTNARPKS